ncbi:MAG: hypothetical protein FD189_827 [Elusimicrobia bacterium]|nr:MAG: hypothetical protein FD154_820 [Elusimicrobiota bacterium]KAF0156854.1 MAG: hypothetical protein FD189_827 [Elusimicrobiota bacterium]
MFKIAAALVLFSAPLQAASFQLDAVTVKDVTAAEFALPEAQEPETALDKSGVLTSLHLMPQALKSRLISYAKTEAEFAEFTAMWNPILQAAGMVVGEVTYKADIQMGIVNYTSPKGLVLRRLIADKLNYDALNPTEMHNLKTSMEAALEKNGLPVKASFYVKSDALRPTFVLYYVTRGDENDDHEKQMRILKKGEDIDYDLLETAGVNIIRRDNSFTMLYIGKELGFKSKVATDEAAAAQKLEEYRKFLVENDKEFLGSRTHKLTEPFTVGETTYNYLLNMYFYQ